MKNGKNFGFLGRIDQITKLLVEILSMATETIYRFLKEMLINSVKAAWRLLQIFIFALVPCYMASFGHELILTASGWVQKIVGIVLLGIGVFGVFLVAYGLLLTLIKQWQTSKSAEGGEDRKTARSPRGVIFLLLDILAVVVVFGWTYMHPDYQFQSPLLGFTQGWYQPFNSLVSALEKMVSMVHVF
jgi:TRAP-type C4-dicarboxylate transport system permease small subunit